MSSAFYQPAHQLFDLSSPEVGKGANMSWGCRDEDVELLFESEQKEEDQKVS